MFDLIGAYDIGHPTLLLTNSLGWDEAPDTLINGRWPGWASCPDSDAADRNSHWCTEVTVLPLLRLGELVRDLEAA